MSSTINYSKRWIMINIILQRNKKKISFINDFFLNKQAFLTFNSSIHFTFHHQSCTSTEQSDFHKKKSLKIHIHTHSRIKHRCYLILRNNIINPINNAKNVIKYISQSGPNKYLGSNFWKKLFISSISLLKTSAP